MTKTEQAMIDLLIRRQAAMQEKHKLRKKIAAVKRSIATRVILGDLEGLNYSLYSEVVEINDGYTEVVKPDYSTDELDDLYREYHDCRYEITCVLASIGYQCKKHIKEKSLITEINKLEKELAQ